MQVIMSMFWFVTGAVFGSAANALVYRLPRNMSWTKGRSICPWCKHGLAQKDLIPLLSYLLLRGKCRYCNKEIGLKYFILELVTAVGFVLIYNFSNLGVLESVILCGIFWILTIIAVMDWETKLISDGMVVMLALLTTLLIFINNSPILDSLQGLLIGFGVIGGIWAISKGRAMGSGDIGLQAVLGWGLGWERTLVGLWLAFVIGAIYGSGQLLSGKLKMKSEVAFGPFLIIGAIVSYIWGDNMLSLLSF